MRRRISFCLVRGGLCLLAMLAAGGLAFGAKNKTRKQATGFKPVATKLIRGGQEPTRLVVDVTGLQELWLLATIGPDNYSSDQAIWAEPTLIDAAGQATDMTGMPRASAQVGWGKLMIGTDHRGQPLRVGQRQFERGFWAHGPSALQFRLDGKYERFEAWVGIGDAAGKNGSVIFKVLDKADPSFSVANKEKIKAAKAPATQPHPQEVNLEALRLAVEDLTKSFPERYPKGREYLRRLDAFAKKLPALEEARAAGDAATQQEYEELKALQREALLANPLLDFERLLLVRRLATSPKLGLPQNWQGNCSLPAKGFADELVTLAPRDPAGQLQTLFKPETPGFVGDVDLHFDGGKMLFSMRNKDGRWQIWELGADGSGLRQVTPGEQPDVDNYDACYLPDGRILFGSTAPMRGVPCVNGNSFVANLYIMNAGGGGIRQLCFDQEHNWCPTVLNNGRVLYLRWEYTDLPHSNSRILFHMNPDGTSQAAYYGGNSFWPNGAWYARPIPGHPTLIAGIVSGHHGVARMGELILFDPAKSRHEASGVVQRIPGRGKKVEPIIADRLVDASWPKFLHPYPLSDKYFLAAGKPTARSLVGLYLVDVFDNILLLKEEKGYALLEPVPLMKRAAPPAVADKVDLSRQDALVYISDIYAGGGLEGIPRGTVKKLRLFSYHYGYRNMGGLLGVVGMDGPWDIKRVLGTVPVEADGSALFRIPANTPIAIHPLDAEGKTLQRMRSWFTAMPGEQVSCVGCHEKQNSAPPGGGTLALRNSPAEIEPWRGPVRGFSFAREVQPVLDKYCIGCHDGQARADGATLADLRGTNPLKGWKSVTPGQGKQYGGQFSQSYAELHKFVRRPGIESDIHLLTPMEFHADTTELVQLLQQDHHGVRLDEEAWDRLVTWIDLNAPFHGYWHEIVGEGAKTIAARQSELGKLYAGLTENQEIIPEQPAPEIRPIIPAVASNSQSSIPNLQLKGWPFDAQEARRRQNLAGEPTRTIDLGDGVQLELVRAPAGEFVMGANGGDFEEGPLARVKIERPFWMGRFEVTNAQYARFDPQHDSHVETKHAYQFGVHGFPVDGPNQPVVRVSWERATAYCQWLSEKTGLACGLPTEAQWEYACRAGTATPFSFGAADADFSKFANLADLQLTGFADDPYKVRAPLANPTPYDDWIPKDARFDDGGFVSIDVGRYQPNAWGYHDMHGNVWEWTRSNLAARDNPSAQHGKIVRGGSWYDRPKRASSSFRLAYRPYQRVFNVGFRVVAETKVSAPTKIASGD